MTDHYVQVIDDGVSAIEMFWRVDATVAYQGIIPSELGTHYANPGEEMIATLKKRFPAGNFYKLRLAPGEYYPRMARPSSTQFECSPGFNPDHSAAAINVRTTSTGQLHALIGELQKICRVVHPTHNNFAAYGHEIRNITIIASTEVEAHWKNILKANGAKGKDTHDYIKLSVPMRLGEYRVALPWYPWLEPITPFENWLPDNEPTKALSWYDAYNYIKHDRETNFPRATLINALKSVTGCFVMLCAQYGWDFARRGEIAPDAFFQLIAAPKWEPSEIYVPPLHGTSFKERLYPFGA